MPPIKQTTSNKPPFLENFRLYGSCYSYIDKKIKIILPFLWLLPHDIRRTCFRKLFPKEYWRVVGARQELEASFTHHEHKNLTYSIRGFHENQCIFIHIPKCAGISLSQSLFGHCVPHATITDYQIMFGASLFKKYFKFTIVRNPWDRLVSAYFFIKNGGFDSTDKFLFTPFIEEFPTFDSFVRFIYFNKNITKLLHLLPQHHWIQTPAGDIPIDYIGKLENLSESLKVIKSELNIDCIPSPKRINSSPRERDYHKYYTKETANMVAEIYKKDIKLLGYKFGA